MSVFTGEAGLGAGEELGQEGVVLPEAERLEVFSASVVQNKHCKQAPRRKGRYGQMAR